MNHGSGIWVTMVVAAAAAHAAGSIQTFDVAATDLAYDSVSRNIYAAVTNRAGITTNEVVTIDTHAGVIGLTTALPGIPNKVAVSANGEFLYVGFEETNMVMRLALPSLHTNLVFVLEGDTPGSRLFVESMLALPSDPHAVVIARRKTWNTSPRHEGVAVYDDGVKRPVNTDDHIGSNVIDFGPTEEVLYGATIETSPSSFFRMRISATGVVTERAMWGGVESFYERAIDYDAGFVYAGLGNVIDPEAARTVQRFYSSHVKADSGINRITTLQAPDNARTIALSFFEQHARVYLGGMTVSNVYGTTRGLIRWGSDGVAFANSGGRVGFPSVTVTGRVFLVRSPCLVRGPAADLSIRLEADTALGLVDQDVVYTATVSNAGPNSVSNVLVRHRLPWISMSATRSYSVAGGDIQIPGLGVGETVTLSFACQTNKPFTLSNVVWAGSAAADPDLGNNIASVITPVSFYSTSDQVVAWPELRVKDIVWDARGRKIYAITPPNGSNEVDSLVAIDPLRAAVGPVYPLGANAWRLEVSHAGEYLYVLQGTSSVRRFSLPALDSHFQFQSLESITRIAIAPGNPTRVAIYGRDRTRIYDNGVALGRAYTNAAVGEITFGTTASRLYALNYSSYYIFKFNVTQAGLIPQDEGVLSQEYTSGFFAGGRFYMRNGAVFDAESRTKVGQLNLQSAANFVLPDLAKGLLYAYSYPQLKIFDAQSFNTRSAIQPLPSVSFASRILRWGDDGLALLYNDQLTILRSSYIGDLDRDGLTDAWETTYFGSTNSPTALRDSDADEDGLLNWRELVAGTNPVDPGSGLRLRAELEREEVKLHFASTQTRYYNIERISSLTTNQWTTRVRNIPGTGGDIEVIDKWGRGEPAFYRLRVLE